jgi:MinD-like ATPase involved in chromosome partitioning or flagellar assembly
MTVRFDDSLPRMAAIIAAELGTEALSKGVILRDVTGQLAFFSATGIEPELAKRVEHLLYNELGPYARPDRVFALPSEPGARAILEDFTALRFSVTSHTLRLVDRRLVGADWLRRPAPAAPPPPRFVFASLKGGVGRSTALAVVAAHLAATGRRVLAIDLDMEAPGLGAFLLDPDTVPPFGTIDVLVEANIAELDEAFYADTIASSRLAATAGRIDVLPAFGRRSIDNPADVLAKLARAYAEDVRADDAVATVLDKVRKLVDRFAEPQHYDVILVDIRAGLHETTASAILGLGAEVLLFGLDEPQTFQGYAALLAHLGRFVSPGEPVPEWVERLTPVLAKASADASMREDFGQRWRSLVDERGPVLVRTPEPTVLPAEQFYEPAWDYAQSDEDVLPIELSLHQPIAVFRDDRYEGFDPLARRDLLSEALYRSTFGALIDRIEEAIASARGGQP